MIFNVAGLAIALGLTLLIAMVWQGVASTGEAARHELDETLNRAMERLRILIGAAEMTAESGARAARTPEVTGATLRSTLENSLAAFEQRPELSYLGIVLPGTGEYGCLERTASGAVWLWLFPGTRANDPVTRNFLLTDHGFTLHEERPTDGYDPRSRPFYQAAVKNPAGGTWLPSYQWIIHAANSEPLWGFSYVKALRDAKGRLICTLDTDFDMPALNNFLLSLGAEYRCTLQIVELGDTPRLIGDPAAGRTPLPLPETLAPLAGSSGEGFVGRMRLDGERRWVAAHRLDLKGGISWLVVASRKDPLIAAPLRRQLYEVVGTGLAIAAGLVLVSVRMARRFGKPLAELEQRVAEIGSHEPEAPAAAAMDGFRETQLLGEAFDRMVVAVRQRERELAAQNSQLVETEQSLRHERDYAAAVLNSLPGVFYHYDENLRLLRWNKNLERISGYSAEELAGADPLLFFAEEEKALVTSRIAEVFEKGESHVEADYLLKDGRRIPYLFTGVRFDFDGRRHLIGVGTDLEEHTRTEDALRQSLARFDAAARATGDVVWDWDLVTNEIWWNANFQTLFGYAPEEIESGIESWTRRVHPEDSERVIAHIHAIIDGPEETWVDEYRFLRKDGTWADVFDRGHVLRDASGRGVRMVGAIQDVTERKKAHAQLLVFNAELEQRVAHRTRELQTLNKELETFCYSVSHDLRAPLRGIAGFAEILAKNHAAALDEKARNYLGRVLAATHRMGDLIDDLLNLSRVSRDEMHREPVDLSAIARDILANLRHTAPERRVEIAVEDGLRAEGDARLLRVLLENLLNNAWKFTSKTPDARIAFAAAGHEVGEPAFAVSDNGAGFDMRYANKLFGPFQRLHRATEFPGTGIGLATVQRIVHRHGGSITAQAEPGKGATFRFSL